MKEPRRPSTQEVRPRTLTIQAKIGALVSSYQWRTNDPSQCSCLNKKISRPAHHPTKAPQNTFRISINTKKTSPQKKEKQKKRPCHNNPKSLSRATSSKQKTQKHKINKRNKYTKTISRSQGGEQGNK
jgi:hypothetical protein